MPIDVTMPALSPTMEKGTLARWLVRPGDQVRAGDVIAEIETDKATMEVEAAEDGEVLELLVPEGTEEVPVNAVIARLRGAGEAGAPAGDQPPGEAPRAPPAGRDGAEAPPPAAGAARAEPAPGKGAAPSPQEIPAASPAAGLHAPLAAPARQETGAPGQPPARRPASPLARRLARLRGVDLTALRGTGPHGRIVAADVEAAARAHASSAPAGIRKEAVEAAPPSPVALEAGPPEIGPPFETVRLSTMRKTIARRLTESKATVPHYYLRIDVRLDALMALRSELNRVLEGRGIRISVNDMLVKALAAALLRVPDANASFAGDHIRRYGRADISVAVAVPGGLVTPVVRDAAAKPLSVIATEMRDLVQRAREGKLRPEDYQGGTASLSNLGMYGIRDFAAVINPPEGMILAVGAAEKRPVVADDAVAVAHMMTATGSFDHRAIDGAVGAELMAAFREIVEAPLVMLA